MPLKIFQFLFNKLTLGPLAYLRLNRFLSYQTIVSLSYLIIAQSGLAVLGLGNKGPAIFCLLLLLASMFANVLGPPRTNLMLEQVEGDTGSAVSLIMSAQMLFGSIGMIIMPMVSGFRIQSLGGGYLVIGLISLTGWIIIAGKPFIRHLDYKKYKHFRTGLE